MNLNCPHCGGVLKINVGEHTCIYGSYDCPEVWTLRRYRDKFLSETWYGRAFIRTYYAFSPAAVRLFGNHRWFRSFFRRLNKMVSELRRKGFEDSSYNDKNGKI